MPKRLRPLAVPNYAVKLAAPLALLGQRAEHQSAPQLTASVDMTSIVK